MTPIALKARGRAKTRTKLIKILKLIHKYTVPYAIGKTLNQPLMKKELFLIVLFHYKKINIILISPNRNVYYRTSKKLKLCLWGRKARRINPIKRPKVVRMMRQLMQRRCR